MSLASASIQKPISVLSSDFIFDQKGRLDYGVFRLQQGAETWYRAVVMRELTALTLLDLENANMLGTMTGAMRGLYGAKTDFQYAVLGIFHPEHIGICQLYGTAHDGRSPEEAARGARERIGAIEVAMANFEQSRMRPPSQEIVDWYVNFLRGRAANVQIMLGYPDPRTKKRGTTLQDGIIRETGDDLAVEQNEMIFRGLAKARVDFVYQAMAGYISREEIIRTRIRFDRLLSNYASRQESSRSISFGIGIPILASLGHAVGGGTSTSQSQAESTSDSVAHGWGESHSDSHAVAKSVSSSTGVSESWTESTSHAEGQSAGTSWGHTDSASHTDSSSASNSQSESWGTSQSQSHSEGSGTSQGVSVNMGQSTMHSDSSSLSLGASGSTSGGLSAKAEPLGMGLGMNLGGSVGTSIGTTSGVTDGVSSSISHGSSMSSSTSVSDSTSSGSSHATSVGTTTSSGSADSTGTADSTGGSESRSVSDGTANAHSWGITQTTTTGRTTTDGTSDGTSENFGQGHATGSASGSATGLSASQAFSGGISSGLAPSINMGETWRTIDKVAVSTTQLMELVDGNLNECAAEGGFLSQVLIFTEDEKSGREASTLIPQAFHGPAVATPVMSRQPETATDLDILRDQVIAGLPGAEGPDRDDILAGALGNKYSTLLSPARFACCVSPAIIREGTCRILHPLPAELSFYASPKNNSGILLGQMFSPTTRDLTDAGVYLPKRQLMHTVFAANTGFGKSVAAQTMVCEMADKWNMRVVVLDFGFAWRKLINSKSLAGRVDIRQLRPDGVRPLRWNPLKVGRYVDPEVFIREFVDIFGSVGQLGQKQQQHRFLDVLRRVFVEHGVLVNDPKVINDPVWGLVAADESDGQVVDVPVGTATSTLSMDDRQKLVVHRSSKVSLSTLHDYLTAEADKLPASDRVVRPLLEGIIVRLKGLVTGPVAAQFGASLEGDPALSIEDLGREGNGVTILEGGKFLDNFSKAFLLGWASRLIYADMVARRERFINQGEPDLVMVFEEANIIFTGLEKQAEDSSGPSVSEHFSNMFRDSRKYGCYFMVITQSPSLLPPAIFSSCNNMVIGYITNPKDKDLILAAWARSEKGFHDEPHRRFLSDMSIGMFVGRFPFSFEREDQQLFLFKPTYLDVAEPTDTEIVSRLGRITLHHAFA